jgi:hypothetical protein
MDQMSAVPGAEDARVRFRVRSHDGLVWQRLEPSKLPSPAAIVRDAEDSNPARRHKAVFGAWAELDAQGRPRRVLDKAQWAAEGGADNRKLVRGIFTATSADGLKWEDFRRIVYEELPAGKKWWTPGAPGWAGGDNFPCLIYAPERRKWVAFFRTNIDQGQRGSRRERGVGRAESADFNAWESHELALHAQTAVRAALGYEQQDYYQLQVWPCGSVYLGLLSVFYWREDRVHLELAWSPNTQDWERLCPGSDLVPHGKLREPGGGCRFGAMRPVSIEDEVWVYWGGDDGKHNANPKRQGYLFLNIFRRDRFAGYAVKDAVAGGQLLSRSMKLGSGELLLNADARDGEIRAELVDAAGKPLPRFALQASKPISGDHLAAPLRWDGGDSQRLAGQEARLRLIARGRVTIYALRSR